MNYDVIININNVSNEGKIAIFDNKIILHVLEEERTIKYNNISSVSLNDNWCVIVLKDSTVVNINSKNVKEIFDLINSKKDSDLSTNVKYFKYSLIGVVISFLINVTLYDMKLDSIANMFMFVFMIFLLAMGISLLFMGIEAIKSLFKVFSVSGLEKEKEIYSLVLNGLPVLFWIVPIIYHNTGARAAVNDCYKDMPLFVSCSTKYADKEGKIYTCYSRGKKAVVTCGGEKCVAMCER